MTRKLLLSKFKVIPFDPTVLIKLIDRAVKKLAKNVLIYDWFLDEEASEVYFILEGFESDAEHFTEKIAAYLRGEGIWADVEKAGLLQKLASVRPAKAEIKVVIKGEKTGKLFLAWPDGNLQPLESETLAKLLIQSNFSLDEATQISRKVQEIFTGRNAVSPKELYEKIVEIVGEWSRLDELVLLKANLMPYLYVVIEDHGLIRYPTQNYLAALARQAASICELKPTKRLIEELADHVLNYLRREAALKARKFVLEPLYPDSVLPSSMIISIMRKWLREHVVFYEELRKNCSIEDVLNNLRARIHQAEHNYWTASSLAEKKALAFEIAYNSLTYLSIASGHITLGSFEDLAEASGKIEILNLLNRTLKVRSNEEALRLLDKIVEESVSLLKRLRQE